MDTTPQKTDEELSKDFLKEYEELTKKYKMMIVPTPIFKLRDDNTYSVLIQVSVKKLKAETE